MNSTEFKERDNMENIAREGDTGFISGIITPIRGVSFPRIDPGSSFELVPPGQNMVLSAGVVHLADGRGRMSHFYTPSWAFVTGPAFCAWTPESALGPGGIHGLIERLVISNRSSRRTLLTTMSIMTVVLLALFVRERDDALVFGFAFMLILIVMAPFMLKEKVTRLPQIISEERYEVSFPGAVRKQDGADNGVCPAGFGCGDAGD